MDNVIKLLPLTSLTTSELHPHLEFQNDNLDNLINSIKKYGIIEPLMVRPKDEKFEIILGNRRYNAAKQLGLEKVPVIITNINDETALNLIITDNIQRKELSSKEEAKLYNEALSYPNVNKEKLSIDLGIPLDRITSKLELIKKDSPKIENNNLNTESQYQNNNNSINNDIINLSELNKEEIERDEIYMNNNQQINNNLNQGINNNIEQEPTFGGRFFPSLEDQPTNMNMNNQDLSSQTAFSNNLNNGPLIDLTDTAPEQQTNIPTSNTINQVQQQINDTNNTPIYNQMPEQNVEMPQQEVYNIPTNMQNLNQEPNIPQYNNIENIPNLNPIPEQNAGIPQQEVYNTPENIPNLNPMPEQNAGMPQQEVYNTPENIPNLNPIPEQTGNIENYEEENNEETNGTYNVVNTIRDLAMDLESFGYRINIDENETETSYLINIEVEK